LASLIPRFAIRYGTDVFAAGCRATLAAKVPPVPNAGAPLDQRVFGNREMFWTGSGRQALSLLLVALKLGRGAKVGIPLFSSSAVAAAVKAAGCEPHYLDVDPRTLTLDPKEIARSRTRLSAIVPVHLFGNVADMDRILDAAAGVPVIEDTAQCLTGYWHGRLAGSFGIAGFYSFASSKCIPAGGGGMAVLNSNADGAMAAALRELVSKLEPRKRSDSLRSAVMQFAKTALFSRALYGPLGNRMRAGTEETGYLLAQVDARAIAPSSAAAVRRLIPGFTDRMLRQRENSLKLIGFLRDVSGIVLPVEPAAARYGYTLFPVLVGNTEERDNVRRIMLEHGVDTSEAHHNSAAIAAQNGYSGSCPVAEHVAGRVLTIPNFAELTTRDLERVSSVFITALNRARAAGRVRRIFEARAV